MVLFVVLVCFKNKKVDCNLVLGLYENVEEILHKVEDQLTQIENGKETQKKLIIKEREMRLVCEKRKIQKLR